MFPNSFWGCNDDQYQARTQQLSNLAAQFNASLTAVPQAFIHAEDGEAAAKMLNDQADLVILDVASFPEGKAAGVFFDSLVPPVMLWSRPESEHGTHIGHNSFCGANFIAGNLALKKRQFRNLFGEIESPDFKARFCTAVELTRAAKQASGSTIGLFGGGIVPKFFDLEAQPEDQALLEKRWGIRFAGVPIQSVVDKAKSYKDSELVELSEMFVKQFREITVSAEAIQKLTRIYKAIADITKAEGYASTAVRCWPELQSIYGMWPCSGLSLLNETGIPCACEGDPVGALDMLLAAQMSSSPSTLIDVVDWDERQEQFTIWHCGPTACSWADNNDVRLIPHNVDGLGPDGKPAQGLAAVVDMTFTPGPVSVFRTLGAIDNEFVVQGELVRAPERKISGCSGFVSAPTVYDRPRTVVSIREEIMHRALPHHYVAARGHFFSGKESQ